MSNIKTTIARLVAVFILLSSLFSHGATLMAMQYKKNNLNTGKYCNINEIVQPSVTCSIKKSKTFVNLIKMTKIASIKPDSIIVDTRGNGEYHDMFKGKIDEKTIKKIFVNTKDFSLSSEKEPIDDQKTDPTVTIIPFYGDKNKEDILKENIELIKNAAPNTIESYLECLFNKQAVSPLHFRWGI